MKLEMKLNSLYICVKDMRRAINFYEELFEKEVSIEDQIFSIFDLDGFRFCLFDNSKVDEEVTWGDNCLPSFQVNNMDKLIEKLTELKIKIVYPKAKIKNNWVLEFKDSEGNDIEAYSNI